jgi:hypothetical protein
MTNLQPASYLMVKNKPFPLKPGQDKDAHYLHSYST